MKHHMKGKLKREDEEWMRQCCCVMDTNSFEFLRVFEDGAQTSLRGLYPLASIMNNECSPNTCHVYDANGIMKVWEMALDYIFSIPMIGVLLLRTPMPIWRKYCYYQHF